MVTRNYSLLIDKFAIDHDLEMFSLNGQTIFPVYGVSGGVCASYIAYFIKPGHKWPEGDVGREGNTPNGVIAIEWDHHWTDEQIMGHFAKRLTLEMEASHV